LRRQSEHRAVPAAVLKLDAPALCTPVAAQFAERSFAVPVVLEQPALQKPEVPAEHSRKPQALLVKISPQLAELQAVREEQ